MTGRQLARFADKAAVAAAVVARLGDVVTDAVAERGVAHLVLTGGSMGEAVMKALTTPGAAAAPSDSPVDSRIEWSAVHLWWGDERFLPLGHPDRNDSQADGAGLGRLFALGLEPTRVHRLPGPDDPVTGPDLPAAAAAYADQLRRAAGNAALPGFDVVMLGVGPDGHVASLFPGHPSTADAGSASATVVPVEGSPKAPPRRLSMSLPALCSGRQVWLLVAGADKAQAVRRAQQTSDAHRCPAGAVHGRQATIWWLDDEAAGDLGTAPA